MKFKDDLQKSIYYQSQIDFCYWGLKELNEILQNSDENFNYTSTKNEMKELTKTMIRCKIKLGHDVVKDNELLNQLST